MLSSLPLFKRTAATHHRRKAPIVTLLTDFGLADPYVGTMKGVIAGISASAHVVDLCHEVEPYGVAQAGFLLARSFGWFPPGSVHVAVVDPGVGSSRRALVVDAMGHRFVGPDNGIFSMLFREAAARDTKGSGPRSPFLVRALSNPDWMLHQISNTFHGRDVFAPAAAHLAAGRPPADAGPAISDALRQDWDLPVRTGKRFWNGAIMHSDRFGNLITNLRVRDFPLAPESFQLQAGAEVISTVCRCFDDAKPGESFLIEGSYGYWEISLRQASARKRLGLVPGSPIELARLR